MDIVVVRAFVKAAVPAGNLSIPNIPPIHMKITPKTVCYR